MTLQEANRQMVAAAHAEDIELLLEALAARAEAIETASPEEMAAVLDDGESVLRILRSFKRRLHLESRRLDQIEQGFLRDLPPANPRVDFRL